MIKKRFQIGSILIFGLAAIIMITVMYAILQNATKEVSKDYVRLYAADTSGSLVAYINYKISRDDVPLGIIRNGKEFSRKAAELFSAYDNDKVRGYIINENGVIYMDSDLLDGQEFFTYGANSKIENEVDDPVFTKAVRMHLSEIDDYFDKHSELTVVELSTGEYGYATIAPIEHTYWSVVTLYKTSSLFNLTGLMPLFFITFFLLIIFAILMNVMSDRLIFKPLYLLINSLGRLNKGEDIYGIERKDEYRHPHPLSRYVRNGDGFQHYRAGAQRRFSRYPLSPDS